MSERVNLLLDPERVRWLDRTGDSSVVGAGGTLGGKPVVIAATDPSRAAGSIDSADASMLLSAITFAAASGSALVLLLDSAGARLTEGVQVLGGFRRLLRAVLQAATAGTPVVAIAGHHCFGGASLLAFAAHRRIYPAGGQFGLSGPKAVLALDPTATPADVREMYANERRAGADTFGVLVADRADAVRDALVRCLDTPIPKLGTMFADTPVHVMRGERLDSSAFAMCFPRGYELHAVAHVVAGTAPVADTMHRVAGLIDGAPVTPAACEALTSLLISMALEAGAAPVILLLDSPGQSPAIADEAAPFSMLLVRLGAALLRLRAVGHRVELWITGQAGGAVYVVLAAAVDSVIAWPGARVGTLPRAAIISVLGGREAADQQDLVAAGVIDRRMVPSATG